MNTNLKEQELSDIESRLYDLIPDDNQTITSTKVATVSDLKMEEEIY